MEFLLTLFENHRKSLILQHCERSELCLHLGQKFIKNAKIGQFGEFFLNETFLVIFKHCVPLVFWFPFISLKEKWPGSSCWTWMWQCCCLVSRSVEEKRVKTWRRFTNWQRFQVFAHKYSLRLLNAVCVLLLLLLLSARSNCFFSSISPLDCSFSSPEIWS